jgi:AcrR family transcriptional regulator
MPSGRRSRTTPGLSPGPEVPRAKQRTPELRERVLQVALATLAAEGTGGFTTRRVAAQASTSTPAVYELFGDKAGLVREMFFEGFRLLRQRFDELAESGDPRHDLIEAARAFRGFVRDYPVLGQLMFARPFADFDPGPAEREAGRSTREFIVTRVRRCIDAGVIGGVAHGDETDMAHVLLALCQGLSIQEAGGWLGTSPASMDRRWNLAIQALLAGLAPAGT